MHIVELPQEDNLYINSAPTRNNIFISIISLQYRPINPNPESTDNARDSVNLVSGIIHLPLGLDFLVASETYNWFYLTTI